MTLEEARQIYSRMSGYISFMSERERVLIETPSEAIAAIVTLDGDFTALELEAVLTLMRSPNPEQEVTYINRPK